MRLHAVMTPPEGRTVPSGWSCSMLTRAWIARPRGTLTPGSSSPSAASVTPPASWIWEPQMSTPVTSSVTVCLP